MDIQEAVRKRKSVRDYLNTSLSGELKEQVQQIINEKVPVPFGNKPRFSLIENQSLKSGEAVKIGTYGYIKGAKYFIAGAVERKPMADFDYGYALETIILKLTTLGLGTCWLGGTLRRKDFAGPLGLAPDEYIPAITPVGIPAANERFFVKIQKLRVNPHKRKEFETLFFYNQPGILLEKEKTGRYEQALEMLRLSPSADNFQPWRAVFDSKGIFHFYLKRSKIMRTVIKTADLQLIDLGIALSHFDLTLKENGIAGTWEQTSGEAPLASGLEYVVSWKPVF
ncbi:MAG: nitroreductase family protein [Bacteroidales bacterium]|nr:nitroreductase family protein [Bacteroidales bacterium]